MENINTEESAVSSLTVTEEMRSHIYEIAKWAGFLAIVGFVFSGFLVVFAFTFGAAMQTSPEVVAAMGQLATMGSAAVTIVLLITAFIFFYPSLMLFKYASKAKLGVLYGEQASLNEAFAKMKSLFKFWGIMIVIWLSLNVISVISMIMGGVSA